MLNEDVTGGFILFYLNLKVCIHTSTNYSVRPYKRMEVTVVLEQDESCLQYRKSILVKRFPRKRIEGKVLLQYSELHDLLTFCFCLTFNLNFVHLHFRRPLLNHRTWTRRSGFSERRHVSLGFFDPQVEVSGGVYRPASKVVEKEVLSQ